MLNVLLVDDEPAANKRMRSLLARHPGVAVLGVAGSVREAAELLAGKTPDAIFLDVQMPGAAGLDLLPSVPKGVQIVFVTAHEHHAVQAFAVGATDYLVKPIDPERLAETLDRLRRLSLLSATIDPQPAAKALAVTDTVVVPLRGGGSTTTIRVGDICWVESLRHRTRLGLRRPGRVMVVQRRLSAWQQQLPADLFVRVGRSEIVHAAAVERTEWKSRDETVVTFGSDAPRLVLGRLAAMRLRERLSRR